MGSSQTQSPHHLKQDGPVPSSPLKFLIVDDEMVLRRLVSRVIRRTYPHAVVAECQDGGDAFQQINRIVPNVLILDLLLPHLNGLDLCRLVRKEESLDHMKILAISGYLGHETRDEFLSAGADGFVTKPFQPNTFMEHIRRLVEPPLSKEVH